MPRNVSTRGTCNSISTFAGKWYVGSDAPMVLCVLTTFSLPTLPAMPTSIVRTTPLPLLRDAAAARGSCLHRPALAARRVGVRSTPPDVPQPMREEVPGTGRSPDELPSIDLPPEFQPPPGLDVPMPCPEQPGPSIPSPPTPEVPSIPSPPLPELPNVPRNPDIPPPLQPPDVPPPRAPPEVLQEQPPDVVEPPHFM
ncbi:hypothetical protein GUJ93_ZPchr0003g16785 [Zizania palustris]|uniref:Uncharacterized protein n=1 Tax=Zizania palustris TaxID=103762 RepID=A0A8J5S694_ZIZPA|nr:hypothetical protein GUJ93_ZPchr0003g16785 [Zizania palustris]